MMVAALTFLKILAYGEFPFKLSLFTYVQSCSHSNTNFIMWVQGAVSDLPPTGATAEVMSDSEDAGARKENIGNRMPCAQQNTATMDSCDSVSVQH